MDTLHGRDGPANENGGRGEFDGPPSTSRPTQSASEPVFSNGIPFPDSGQIGIPAPCDAYCCSDAGGVETGSACFSSAGSPSTRVSDFSSLHSISSDDSGGCPVPSSDEGTDTRAEDHSRDDGLEAFLPDGPLAYDIGWFSVAGMELRVALGAGPANPDLRSFLREILFRPPSPEDGPKA